MFDGALGIVTAVSALKVLKIRGMLENLKRPVEVTTLSLGDYLFTLKQEFCRVKRTEIVLFFFGCHSLIILAINIGRLLHSVMRKELGFKLLS